MRILLSILLLLPVASSATMRIVFEGDSITASTIVPSYPYQLTNGFLSYPPYVWGTNASLSGDPISAMVTQYPTEIRPWKPSGGTNAIVFLLGGVNSLRNDALFPTNIFAAWSNWLVSAGSDGFRRFAFTVNIDFAEPVTNWWKWTNFNADVRSNPQLYDYLIDIANDYPNGNDTNLYSDGLHWTSNLHYMVSQRIKTNLVTAPDWSVGTLIIGP